MTAHEVWYGNSLVARAVRTCLLPLSLLYATGWQLYLLIYRLGFKKAKKPHQKIVVVGNLVAGGTGKTPTVVFVAKCLLDLGHEVVIGCSGYGSPRAEGATLAPPGPLTPDEWGDEPTEIREMLPELPMIVGRGRVKAAEVCAQSHPNAILLMDDGFQHMPLAKDLSIILDPFTPNSFTFPAGPYRESRRTGRKRADLVIPSSKFQFTFSSLSFVTPKGDTVDSPQKANIVTAIGRPDNFRRNLEEAGISIQEFEVHPDHDKLDIDLSQRSQEIPWVVTQKDWVKLRTKSGSKEANVLIARRSATVEPVAEFKKWLTIKLG
jgi:tetraacyldisaccharide 4'-kinase